MGVSVEDIRTPGRQSEAVQTITRYAPIRLSDSKHAAGTSALGTRADARCWADAALRNGTPS